MSVKQISIFLENKPGKMCEMTEVLAANKINMRALSLAETDGFGIVRIIVDDVYEATTILKDAGYINKLTSVVIVELPDVPGELTVEQMLRQAEDWGVRPRNLRKTVGRTHVFTHVEWKLTCCYLDCAQESAFTWVTRRELEEKIGLPTAYRQFLAE